MNKMKKTKKQVKKENKILDKLKKFFNSPQPIIIVLVVLCIFLSLFAYKSGSKNKIFVGEVLENDLLINNVHYFTNNDMNYFFASNAQYIVEKDVNIVECNVGYYVVDKNNNYIDFAVRKNKFDKATSLRDVIKETSGWNFAEPHNSNYFFNADVLKNINNLHFLVEAKTDSKLDKFDIVIDYPVKTTKITK